MAVLLPPQPTIVKNVSDWKKICEKALTPPTPEQKQRAEVRNKCFDLMLKK